MCRLNDSSRISQNMLCCRDLPNKPLEVPERWSIENPRRSWRRFLGRPPQDRHGVFYASGPNAHLEEEPIQLSLGQRVRAFHVDRILRGENEEWVGEWVADPRDRHATLLHRFEERRLCLGSCPIDLICQDEVAENGTRLIDELSAALAIIGQDVRAENVRWHEIGCELDPRKVQMQYFAQSPDQKSLSETGNALQEQMAAGQEAQQHLMDHLLVADDNSLDLALQRGDLLLVGRRFSFPVDLHGALLTICRSNQRLARSGKLGSVPRLPMAGKRRPGAPGRQAPPSAGPGSRISALHVYRLRWFWHPPVMISNPRIPGSRDTERPLRAVGLFLTILVALVGCRSLVESSGPTPLERGRALLVRDEFSRAHDVFELALQEKPRSAPLVAGLAEALEGLGHSEEAKASWQRARELDPWTAEYPASLAELEYRERHLTVAVSLWEEAIRIDPEFAGAFYNLAVARIERGEERAALEALERFRELEPEDPKALFLYARTLILLGRNTGPATRTLHAERGRREMERFLALEGQDVEAYTYLGLSYADSATDARDAERIRLLEAADENLKKAVYLAPSTPELHHNLGVVCAARAASTQTLAEQLWENLERRPETVTLVDCLTRDDEERRRAQSVLLAAEAEDRALIEMLIDTTQSVVRLREDTLRYYRRALEADSLFLPSLENLALQYASIPNQEIRTLEIIDRALERESVPSRRERLKALRIRIEGGDALSNRTSSD